MFWCHVKKETIYTLITPGASFEFLLVGNHLGSCWSEGILSEIVMTVDDRVCRYIGIDHGRA